MSGTTTQSARLFDRRMSIVVADASGQGIELAGLRCTFIVKQFELANPNTLDLHITNLSKATAERMKKEFTQVQVSAGYEGQYGIIFKGNIIQSRRGRDSPTDTYCHIVAADADTAHNLATVSTTLAAGSTPADHHRVALQAMAPFGVVQGYTDPAMTGPALPRGKVLFGMARDVLHDVGRTTGTSWSVQNGRVQVVSPTGYLDTEAVVITAATGMVGMPVIAPDGIYLRCLLNPLLKVNQRIKLDNESIQSVRMNPAPGGVEDPRYEQLAHTESDGVYKVLAVDHVGDTRGNAWYSEICAIAASEGGTPASGLRQRVAPIDIQPLSAAATLGSAGQG